MMIFLSLSFHYEKSCLAEGVLSSRVLVARNRFIFLLGFRAGTTLVEERTPLMRKEDDEVAGEPFVQLPTSSKVFFPALRAT